MSLRDKLARAMRDGCRPHVADWEELDSSGRSVWLDHADACLALLRAEPVSEEVMIASNDAYQSAEEDAWRTAIEAAIRAWLGSPEGTGL